MTHSPLFCIAEEAKSSIRTILDKLDHRFFLVETQECPSEETGLRTELVNDEAFETGFVGASEQDCQRWMLEKQDEAMFIEPNIIAIADARTARDGTILMQWYSGPYAEPPPKSNTWYDFRVDPEGAAKVIASLNFGDPDVIYPTYFGRTEELTDEDGVFNVAKAERMLPGGDTVTPEA